MKLPESTPIQDVLIWLAGGRAELVLDPSSANTRVASALDEFFVRQTLAARLLRRSAPSDDRSQWRYSGEVRLERNGSRQTYMKTSCGRRFEIRCSTPPEGLGHTGVPERPAHTVTGKEG